MVVICCFTTVGEARRYEIKTPPEKYPGEQNTIKLPFMIEQAAACVISFVAAFAIVLQ